MQQKDINYSEIPALTIAAYTTYKITAASINIVKTRKGKHLSVKILRNVNFVDALVSVLSLQYTRFRYAASHGGLKKSLPLRPFSPAVFYL